MTETFQCTLPPRKLVRAKGIGSIPWSKRLSAIYRTLLFSDFRAQKGLSATLLDWQAEDFAFPRLHTLYSASLQEENT